MPVSASLKTSDGRFGYEVAGDSSLPSLVFLHGIGGAARAWRGQIEYFGRNFRAVAWDMPGYGSSTPLATVSIATLADALQDFLQGIGAISPILVGHSIGGMIVQQWLTKNLTSARAIVLAQTSPAFGKADGDWQKSFIEARLGPLDRGETMASMAPTLVKGLVGDHADTTGMEVAQSCMASVPEASYRASMRALLGFDQHHALGDVRVPTLVLSGSRDNNAPPAMMAKMAGCIPSADYVELDGAGHLVNLERPAAFNAVLDQFLAAVVNPQGVMA